MAPPHSPFATFTTSAFALNQFRTNHVIKEKTTQEELIKAAAKLNRIRFLPLFHGSNCALL